MYNSTFQQGSEIERDQLVLVGLEYWRNGTSLRPSVRPDAQAWEVGNSFRGSVGQVGLALLTISLMVIVFATGIL